MKALISLSLLLAGLVAGAQGPVRLEPALAVDIRVKTIDWHPSGNALLYSREEEAGIGVGVYRLGDAEGKAVLHLAQGDTWSSEWFQGSTRALVTVTRKVQGEGGEGKEAAVFLLDAGLKSAREVFSRIVQPNESISIDARLSPSLTHAICKLQVGDAKTTLVLPVNGGPLVPAPDIDQAEARGLSGPSWSANGTAIYGEGLGSGTATLELSGQSGQAIQAGDKSGTFVIQLSGANGEVSSSNLTAALTGLVLRLNRPAPPVGTPVLEVVPTNGVLRQIRSPGPWVDSPVPAATLSTASQRVWLDFGRSRGNANSLWLRRGPTSDAASVLVAAHADSAKIAPADGAIAYITDGVLFVKRILK